MYGDVYSVSGEGEELGVARLQSLVQKECIQLYLKGADSACRQVSHIHILLCMSIDMNLVIALVIVVELCCC